MNTLRSVFVSLVVALLPLCCARFAAGKDAGKLEDALAEPISLKVQQDSLEQCLMLLMKRVREKHPDFTLKIIGNDLQKEGLTRNQVIRNYEATDKPAADILTELVLKAYPNRDVKGPSDPNLKLIWIVGDNPDDAEKLAILITTRAAAEDRGDKLPKVFQPEKQ